MKSTKLLDTLLKNNIIQDNDKEIYAFAIECACSKAINYSIYIAMAIVLKMQLQMLLMAIAFIPLRRNAGGFHAKTKSGCFILSYSLVIIALVMCKMEIPIIVELIILVLSDVLIIILAPLDNNNKRMDLVEKLYFAKRARAFMLVISVIGVVSIFMNLKVVFNCIVLGVCMETILLVMGKIQTWRCSCVRKVKKQ